MRRCSLVLQSFRILVRSHTRSTSSVTLSNKSLSCSGAIPSSCHSWKPSKSDRDLFLQFPAKALPKRLAILHTFGRDVVGRRSLNLRLWPRVEVASLSWLAVDRGLVTSFVFVKRCRMQCSGGSRIGWRGFLFRPHLRLQQLLLVVASPRPMRSQHVPVWT